MMGFLRKPEMKKNEERFVAARNCRRNGLPS
jgi:hypothetical protein